MGWLRRAGGLVNDDSYVPLDPGFGERFARDRRPACQLYLVSPLDVDSDFHDRLRAALAGGPVAAFQFRVKDLDEDAAARLAESLRVICADADVAFLVNDSASLAKRLGADGVHLGQGDGSVKVARDLLGQDAQIGVTCHDSRHLAMEAGEAGADYVAFGAFFDTTTKPTTHRPEPALLTWWTTLSQLPCVAIGGISAANALPLVAAGADFLAVSSAVWAHPEGPAAGVAAFGPVLSGHA